MIELAQWRSAIGRFSPPASRKWFTERRDVGFSPKGLCTFTLFCMVALCCPPIIPTPPPSVNKLILAGDVETNPGPQMTEGKEILAEIRNLRKEHESHFENIQYELSDIKTNVKNVQGELEKLKEKIHIQGLDIEEVHGNVETMGKRVERVEEEVEKLERYSRRENVVFYGIAEGENERTENWKSNLTDIFNRYATEKQWSPNDFVRAHRIGAPTAANKPRPVIARLALHDDKFVLLGARKVFKDHGIGVSNDLTPRQRQELQRLRESGQRGYYKAGKLHIDPNPARTSINRESSADRQQRRSPQPGTSQRHEHQTSPGATRHSSADRHQRRSPRPGTSQRHEHQTSPGAARHSSAERHQRRSPQPGTSQRHEYQSSPGAAHHSSPSPRRTRGSRSSRGDTR